jgi:hypothetical protein
MMLVSGRNLPLAGINALALLLDRLDHLPAETESMEDANGRRFAPFTPAGAEAAREATYRSTCSCVSGASFSTCLAIS